MKRPIPQGLLVAVEGIAGAGKTSIATLLAQWCGAHGLACTSSKEPPGLKSEAERQATAREGRSPNARDLEGFYADRRDHMERCIAPALAEGDIVILDRYFWSSAAHQGSRGADYNDIIAANEAFAPKPNLILVLDLDVDAGLQRIRMRGDRNHLFEAKPLLLRARQILLQLAEQSSNARVLDAAGHLKATFETALRAFKLAALNKVGSSGDLPPERVNLTLELFGGRQSTCADATEAPEAPKMNGVPLEAQWASR